MKYTLLELDQLILSSMDSDEVESITDTTESMQVVALIKSVYFDLIERADPPELYGLRTLNDTSSTTPTILTVPDDAKEVLWVKYDKRLTALDDLRMQDVVFRKLDQFLLDMYNLDASDDTVTTFTFTSGTTDVPAQCRNNQAPNWYTVYDDFTLVFDSYDAALEPSLQTAKTLAYCKFSPPWTEVDSFVPSLDDGQFPLLINECKSLAWAEIKQAQHANAESSARRGWTSLQRKKFRTERPSFFDQLPNYGRK